MCRSKNNNTRIAMGLSGCPTQILAMQNMSVPFCPWVPFTGEDSNTWLQELGSGNLTLGWCEWKCAVPEFETSTMKQFWFLKVQSSKASDSPGQPPQCQKLAGLLLVLLTLCFFGIFGCTSCLLWPCLPWVMTFGLLRRLSHPQQHFLEDLASTKAIS